MTCNREAPSVEEASARWAGQVQFVGIAWIGTDESFQGFIDEHGLTFPQVSDDRGEVYARFEIPAQPAFVIIERDGTMQQVFGAVDGDLLDSLITDALD
ncbi:MAG: redoxin domain-containing protein [Ilumatobacteraceae bacterium]